MEIPDAEKHVFTLPVRTPRICIVPCRSNDDHRLHLTVGDQVINYSHKLGILTDTAKGSMLTFGHTMDQV